MSFQVTVTLTTAGSNTGPFNIYQDLDNYVTPVASGVSKSDLLAGYIVTVGNGATIVRVQSNNANCSNYINLTIQGIPNPTPTPTPTSTNLPIYYYIGKYSSSNTIDCTPTGDLQNTYLNATDYATWSSNGNILTVGMGLYSNNSGASWLYSRIYDPITTTVWNVTGSHIISAYRLC